MRSARSPESEISTALRDCTGTFAAAGFFSLFINLLALAVPLYMLLLYDRVLTSASLSTLTALSIMVAILLVASGLLEFVRVRILTRIGASIDSRLESRVFQAFMDRAVRIESDDGVRPLRDLRQVRDLFSGVGLLSLFDTPWVPIYLAIVFLLHPLLGVVATAGALILFLLALLNQFLTRKPLATAGRKGAAEDGFIATVQRNAESVAAMGMLAGLRQHWLRNRTGANQARTLANDRSGAILAASRTVRLGLQAAILGTGAALVIAQVVSPGAMIAASIIMGRALAPVEQAIGNWQRLVNGRAAYRRLDTLLKQVPKDKQWMRLPKAKGRLSVEKLYAAPPGATQPFLKGLNFYLQAGEALGIAGPSGSGKSTLARLLVGIWPPQHGAVRLDGAALTQWDRQALGAKIGYLAQDVELFTGSVRDNIGRFNVDIRDDAVIEAAKQAGVHDLILSLPDGYNTEIGEGGCCLSKGQRQRIGLARALYDDPALVVLDEPNANLDAHGEIALAHAIAGMKARGQTVVIITHRPNAIALVDYLLVLDNGKQRAFGAKDDILAQSTQQIGNTQRADALVAQKASS